MRILLILTISCIVASCGKKDTIFMSSAPAIEAQKAKDGKPAVVGVPAKDVRPVTNRPLKKDFFLDAIL